MGKARTVAGWLPAVVLVPTVMVAATQVTDRGAEAPMDEVQPLGLGTTWVYDVFDHGEPSGTRVRQVVGPSQLLVGDGVREAFRMSSTYDEYPGRGRLTNQVYVGVHGGELLQYGLIQDGETRDVEPPAPAYRLPAEPGTAFSYDGLLGSQPLVFHTEVTDSGPVEVAGHTFEDCVEWT